MKEWSADAPDGEIMRVAEAGLCGMIEAFEGKAETISPDLMINAALHILSAWVASSQMTSSAEERAADIDELIELLPSCIEYHRTARWLPNPHRADN